MRKLTLGEKQNLENNRDIVGKIAIELSQMSRPLMQIALDMIETLNENDGELYDEEDVNI